jgi:holo-[acyl-carrier protein] synthase
VIYGIGTDVVSVERIEQAMRRGGGRFLLKLFTPGERSECLRRYGDSPDARHARFYAKRFAAKEAVAKALGSGFRDGVRFRDVETASDKDGAPRALLSDGALAYFRSRFPQEAEIRLSLSDEARYAVAFAVVYAGIPSVFAVGMSA